MNKLLRYAFFDNNVNKILLMITILISTSVSGCLQTSLRPCPENTCFPLTSEALNSILKQKGEFDALQISSEYSKLNVRSDTRYSEDGILGTISWQVEKDEINELRYISNQIVVGGIIFGGYEIWDGGEVTYSAISGNYYSGRDLSPNYEDPFFELARLATENPSEQWPPFRFSYSELTELSWTITGDAFDAFQVAHASNETHEIYLEIQGISPMIVGIEIYSNEISKEYPSFSISVGHEDWDRNLGAFDFLESYVKNEYLKEQGISELPKNPVPYIAGLPDEYFSSDEITTMIGTIPDEMRHEVLLSDITLHVFQDNISVSSMNLANFQENITSEDGSWWSITWNDNAPPNLFSGSDKYEIRTNSPHKFNIRVYDNWAESWTDSII